MSIPLTMKAAIYNGMLSENTAPISAPCPTGNCTWPLTPSMAVCGECSNSTYSTFCNLTTCTYTMPSGTVMLFPNWTEASLGLGFQVSASTGAKYNSSKNDRIYIANFDVFGAPYGSFAVGNPLRDPVSQECALWMCIQTFVVQMSSAQQAQTVLSTFSTVDSTMPGGFSGADNFTYPDLPSNMNPTPHTSYTVNIFASIALQEFLSSMFNGTVLLNLESQSPSSDAIEALWNGTSNLNAWMQNLAVSMTNVVRSSDQASHAVYNGTAFQLGVTVRWVWISLPAAMVVASLLFLAIVITKTARSPVAVWKGSPLVYLFFDVDHEIKDSVDTHAVFHKYGRLEKTVGKRRATLKQKFDGGWTFKAA